MTGIKIIGIATVIGATGLTLSPDTTLPLSVVGPVAVVVIGGALAVGRFMQKLTDSNRALSEKLDTLSEAIASDNADIFHRLRSLEMNGCAQKCNTKK